MICYLTCLYFDSAKLENLFTPSTDLFYFNKKKGIRMTGCLFENCGNS